MKFAHSLAAGFATALAFACASVQAQASAPTPPSVHVEPGAAAPRAAAGVPTIDFLLTGTTDLTAEACGASETFDVPVGTDILFCYTAVNTGSVTLTRHDLADSAGAIFNDFPLTLDPGFAAWLVQIRRPLSSGSNDAQWTAYNPGPTDVTSDTDSSAINITPAILYCNGPTSTFSSGIPVGWTSFDGRALSFLPDSDVDWRNLPGCGEGGNYTGGRGDVACATSDLVDPQPYDAQLRSHRFSLAGQTSARLEFLVNYQDFAEGDQLDIDLSTDGGAFWTTLAAGAGDLGGFRAEPGVALSADLTSYLGSPDLRVRWRYHNDSASASDYYAQIDNVRLVCGSGIFFDGFESGDTHAWHAEVLEPPVP